MLPGRLLTTSTASFTLSHQLRTAPFLMVEVFLKDGSTPALADFPVFPFPEASEPWVGRHTLFFLEKQMCITYLIKLVSKKTWKNRIIAILKFLRNGALKDGSQFK